jgi:uracil DNA glycosylase
MPQNLELPQDWMKLLHEEFDKPYFQQIKQFLKKETKEGSISFRKE